MYYLKLNNDNFTHNPKGLVMFNSDTVNDLLNIALDVLKNGDTAILYKQDKPFLKVANINNNIRLTITK